MGRERSSERIIVLGASESGKSYWCKRFVDRIDRRALVFVWDPNGEWAGPAHLHGIRGATVFRSTGELVTWIVRNNPRPEGKRLVVQAGTVRDLELFCRLAYDAGDCWVVIDEGHTWLRAATCPEEAKELWRKSRHRRCNLLVTAQRPTGLSPDIRDNKARTILFRMPGEASLAWVRGEFGKILESATRKLPARSWIDVARGIAPEDGPEEGAAATARKARRRGASTTRKR